MIKDVIFPLIPENLKNKEIYAESVDIFLDILTKHSDIAIDMFNMFDSNKPLIFEEYIKIYAASIRDTFNKAISDRLVNNKLTEIYNTLNISDPNISLDISSFLNEEHIAGLKRYKEGKGKEDSLRFIYDLIYNSSINPEEIRNTNYFKYEISKDNLFEYHVEGELLKELYDKFVVPLTHPVGWIYTYKRIMQLIFKDYFKIRYTYKIDEFYVGTQKWDDVKIDNYLTEDYWAIDSNNDGKRVKYLNDRLIDDDDYRFNTLDFRDIKIGKDNDSESKYFQNGNLIKVKDRNVLVRDNEVISITRYENGKDYATIVKFKSGEVLESHTYPKSLKLYWGGNSEVFNYIDKNILKEHLGDRFKDIKLDFNNLKKVIQYDSMLINKLPYIVKDYDQLEGHSGLVLNYSYNIESSVEDRLKFMIEFGLVDSPCNQMYVGAGNVFVGKKHDMLDKSYVVGGLRLPGKPPQMKLHPEISVTQKAFAGLNESLEEYIAPLFGALSDEQYEVPSNQIFAKGYDKLIKYKYRSHEYTPKELRIIEMLSDKNSIVFERFKNKQADKLIRFLAENPDKNELSPEYIDLKKQLEREIDLYKIELDIETETKAITRAFQFNYRRRTINQVRILKDKLRIFFEDQFIKTHSVNPDEIYDHDCVDIIIHRPLRKYEELAVFDDMYSEEEVAIKDADNVVFGIKIYKEFYEGIELHPLDFQIDLKKLIEPYKYTFDYTKSYTFDDLKSKLDSNEYFYFGPGLYINNKELKLSLDIKDNKIKFYVNINNKRTEVDIYNRGSKLLSQLNDLTNETIYYNANTITPDRLKIIMSVVEKINFHSDNPDNIVAYSAKESYKYTKLKNDLLIDEYYEPYNLKGYDIEINVGTFIKKFDYQIIHDNLPDDNLNILQEPYVKTYTLKRYDKDNYEIRSHNLYKLR